MKLIFFDTETTGLKAANERIVEIAAIELDQTFQPCGLFHEYIDPDKPVGRTERIHGLSDRFLRGRPTFADIAESFIRFVSGAQLWAHNMPFDRSFITAELSRCGYPALSAFAQTKDTLALARRLLPGGCHSLDVLAKHYGIDLSERTKHHGALLDTEILVRVWLCMNGHSEAAEKFSTHKIRQLDAIHQEQRREEQLKRLAVLAADHANDINASCEYREKLTSVIDWADDHPWFDPDLYLSMLSQLDERGFLTERQKATVDRILERFDIVW